jgi:CRISPR-associated endonuclease/helicase Cas3
MPTSDFSAFFTAAFEDQRQPYDYQHRLAELPCESRLITVPTGLGKTAAVVLAWLFNRVAKNKPNWPRRLVYCLPMRTLVEQTAGEAQKWIDSLFAAKQITTKPRVIILMGGEELTEEERNWDLHPEDNTILIGTQDMLLSRALNRGYGMSRYRWPMHFGLLNNDCLWVLDETQLMGVGVETSAQLDGFRASSPKTAGLPYDQCQTWWMSATLEQTRLDTVDHRLPSNGWPTLKLEAPDEGASNVAKRLNSIKTLKPSPVVLSKGMKTYGRDIAKFVLDQHKAGTLTLVIVNQVQRAQEVFEALQKAKPAPATKTALIHSRFRAADRQRQQALLTETGDRIIVATQAIEAGVDVSSRVLITELAPWSSLVQRFGRCNRAGEFSEGADVFWIELTFDKDSDTAPYTVDELKSARSALQVLPHVGPQALKGMQILERAVVRPVIRKKDLLDLFDTTPDLAGQDLDISRYIRDGDDSDVQVCWRDVPEDGPPKTQPNPIRPELCRVSRFRFAAFLDKLNKPKETRKAWVWNALTDKWEAARTARPGAVYIMDRRAGGYDADLGWTGEIADLKKEAQWVPAVESAGVPAEPYWSNFTSTNSLPVSLRDHTSHVVAKTKSLATALDLPKSLASNLTTSAVWHDVGKAIKDFQDMLCGGDSSGQELLAKSGGKSGSMPEHRRYFRHELASALAWLKHQQADTIECSLIAFLIAAHHGKVRISLRSLPDEMPPKSQPSARIARGVIDGDVLPALTLDGLALAETTLDLGVMEMGDRDGQQSWLSRMITLRDHIGTFQLAYLETLLRAADMGASANEANSAPQS